MPPNGQPRRNEQVTEIYSLPKLNRDEADNLNRWITRSETESVVGKKKKNLSVNKSPGLDGFTEEFYKM